MKVKLPEDISDITLDQFIKFDKLRKRDDLTDQEYGKRVISIFTSLPYNKIDNVVKSDYELLITKVLEALNTDVPFTKRFKLGEIEYGFEPDLDGITSGQYFDLKTYQDDIDNMHKLMAVLFRPVTGSDAFGNYKIEDYKGTDQHCETLRQMPMHVVNGALGFFLNLQRGLLNNTLKFISREQKKKRRIGTGKNGAGGQLLNLWPITNPGG